MTALDVLVEQGKRRAFVSVLDWPGWCRSAKTVPDALEAGADYRPRFAAAMKHAALHVPARPDFHVLQTVEGNATTDFGAPAMPCESDEAAMSAAVIRRHLACLQAAWDTLDEVVAHAPASLRKGPRGGGRDRDAVVQHVNNAERAYSSKVGLRLLSDEPITDRRTQLIDTLRTRARQDFDGVGWPTRYAIRRIAWHVLDHAWEIEDRS